MIIRVRASVELDVEVPSDWTPGDVQFYIEENGCPGTSAVGAILRAAIEEGEESRTCAACTLGAENKIIGPPEFMERLAKGE